MDVGPSRYFTNKVLTKVLDESEGANRFPAVDHQKSSCALLRISLSIVFRGVVSVQK